MRSSRLFALRIIALQAMLLLIGATAWGEDAHDDSVMRMLESRVQKSPEHSDSWRLLGRAQADRGDSTAAFSSFARSLELDPTNAAAHFNLGLLLKDQGQTDAAVIHFAKCVAFAPESHYSAEIFAQRYLPAPDEVPLFASEDAESFVPSPDEAPVRAPVRATPFSLAPWRGESDGMIKNETIPVQPTSYEIQTFDGSEDFDRRFEQLESDAHLTPKSLRVFCELGIVYNSNVSLTPISRELFNTDAKSFQAIFNPEIEWIALRNEKWRSGPLLRSFSTINESNQQAFNLFSIQPGWFIERDGVVGDSEWISRIDYVYAADLLDGTRIGDRHSGSASVIIIRPDLDVIYAYLSTNYADFVDDGVVAEETSLDGPSVSAGISRFFQTEIAWMPTYSLGFDLESTNSSGSDFRYRALTTHGGMNFRLSDRWQFIPSGGLGYRDYHAFTGSPSRDELTARVQAKLQFQFHTSTSLSLVTGYDRFASDNELFDAERFQGGIIMTATY